MAEYVYRRLTKDTIVDLHWLFKYSIKTTRSLKEFIKKYNTNYTGISYIGYLAYDLYDKPAAYFGVLPLLALVNNEPVLIAQSADTLTHPDHEFEGLNIKLALMTQKLAKEEGIHFIFGVPNINSFKVFVKGLNWTHNGNLYKFEFKVPMFPFSQLFRRNVFLKNIYNLWVDFILLFTKNEVTGFSSPIVSDNYFGIYRNDDFFSYKGYSKKYIIKILGKKVWLKFEGTLKIGEIENPYDSDLKRLISRLKLIAFMTGVQKIQYQCSSQSGCLPIYSKISNRTESLPIIFLDLTSELSPERLVISLADIDTF